MITVDSVQEVLEARAEQKFEARMKEYLRHPHGYSRPSYITIKVGGESKVLNLSDVEQAMREAYRNANMTYLIREEIEGLMRSVEAVEGLAAEVDQLKNAQP